MANKNQIEPAVEFQALPLEMMLVAPLTAAVKAQRAAAEATLSYVKGFLEEDPQTKVQKPITLKLEATQTALAPGQAAQQNKMTIEAPLLSIVPVPQLRIDSLTVNFKYEVSQVYCDKDQTAGSLDLSAKSGALASPWVEASLKGSLSTSSQQENTVHRGGTLDITLRASEAPMPAGLDRLLTLLSRGIP